jgi:hypothetical protein
MAAAWNFLNITAFRRRSGGGDPPKPRLRLASSTRDVKKKSKI